MLQRIDKILASANTLGPNPYIEFSSGCNDVLLDFTKERD
jgi:hypothetical protein